MGDQAGNNDALNKAVAAYRAALAEWTPDRSPFNWAATLNNLGTALVTLGERESGTTHLTEAVAAYRAALEERARDQVPLDWAATQNNLGNALLRLGKRESDTTHSNRGGRGLPRGVGGTDARSRTARLGGDAGQPWRSAHEAGGAGEWQRPSHRGGRGLPRGP